jgi:hypothetical protein
MRSDPLAAGVAKTAFDLRVDKRPLDDQVPFLPRQF